MTKLSVWVICGGPSGEAEVSRTSGRAVVSALQRAGHSANLVEFEPTMTRHLLDAPPEVVFPVTHGTLGEDGCLQGLLEVFDVPYVGSDVLASAIGANKPCAKVLWQLAGLPVAKELVVRHGVDLAEAAVTARARLGGAVVVKPASGGSAIGVQRVSAQESDARLVEAIRTVLALDNEALVEQWLVGQELTCGVLEQGGQLRALPPTLILPERADFYDFVSKYAPGGSRHVCPAPLAADFVERIQQVAVRAHQVVGARDLSRVDFVVDDRRGVDFGLTILEINTLPGMTSTSLYPEAAGVAGIAFEALVDGLVRQAMARPRRMQPEVMAMPR
jgi:D-alanine-D-alanine ligase